MKTRDTATRAGVQPRTTRRQITSEAIRRITRDLEGLLNDSGDDNSGDGDNVDPVVGDGSNHIHIHLAGTQAGPTNGVKTTAGENGITEDEGDPTAAQRGDGSGGGGAVDPGQSGGGNDNGSEERMAALEQGMLELKDTVQKIIDQLQGGSTGAGGRSEDDVDGNMVDSNEDGEPDGDEFGGNGDGDADDNTKDEDMDDDTAKGKTMDGKGKTLDSAALATSYQRLLADAEVLVPGMRFPTFDAKAKRASTVDNMCKMRRRVIDHLMATGDGANLVASVSDSIVDLNKADCKDIAVVFSAAAAARRAYNNATATRDSGAIPRVGGAAGKHGPKTLAEINDFNRKFYAENNS